MAKLIRNAARTKFLACIRDIKKYYFSGHTAKDIQHLVSLDTEMSYQAFCENFNKYVRVSNRTRDIMMRNQFMPSDTSHLEQKSHTDNEAINKLHSFFCDYRLLFNEITERYNSRDLDNEPVHKDNSSVNELASILSNLIDQKASDRTVSSFENLKAQDDEHDERNYDKEEEKDVKIEELTDEELWNMTSEQKLKLTENMSPQEKYHFSRKYLNIDEDEQMRKSMTTHDDTTYLIEKVDFELAQEKE